MRKPRPKSKSAPVVSTSRRVAVSISETEYNEHEGQSENHNTFLRSRQQRGSSSVPVTVKPEPELESAVEIPDPDSSPPIVVYEWRASPRTPSNDHDADVDIGQAVGGEEFTLSLDSSDARSPNSLSTEGQGQIPPEVVRRGLPRQLLPKEHQKLKPGPKSLKQLPIRQAAMPSSRSSFASPSIGSQDSSSSPERKRCRIRRIRYTLTKEDLKEAIKKALVYDSDNDDENDDSATETDASMSMKTVPDKNQSQNRKGGDSADSSSFTGFTSMATLATARTQTPMKAKPYKVKIVTTPKNKSSHPGSGSCPVSSAATTDDKRATPQNSQNDERVVVELRERPDSASPITVSISKASLDFIRQRPKEVSEPTVSTSTTPVVPITIAFTSRSSTSQSQSPSHNPSVKPAIRAWLTRCRDAAQAKAKLYRTLSHQKGRCQVKLFDMGLISNSVPRVNVGQYAGLIKALGSIGPSPSTSTSASDNTSRHNRTQVKKLVQRFLQLQPKANSNLSTPAPAHVPTQEPDPEIERLCRQFRIKPCVVKMNYIGGEPVVCPICEQRVPMASLVQHKATHCIKCHYAGCGQDVLLGDVIRHGTWHITALRCEICGLRSKNKLDLWCHQNMHYGVRPIICTECGDSFAFTSSYSRHYKQRHAMGTEEAVEASVRVNTLFSRQYCPRRFKTAGGKEKHEWTHVHAQQQRQGNESGNEAEAVDPANLCEIVRQ